MPDGKEKECGRHGRQTGMAERRAYTTMTTILRHTLLWIWRHARPFVGGLLLDIVIGIVGNGIYDSLKTEPTLYQDPKKLALVQFLWVYNWISLGIFLLPLAPLLAAFLVHRADERCLALEHQQRQQALAERDQQQEALSLTTQAVRVLLERQTPATALPPTDAVAHAPQRIWTVPFQRNPFFTGREDELRAIHTQLHRGQATARTCLRRLTNTTGFLAILTIPQRFSTALPKLSHGYEQYSGLSVLKVLPQRARSETLATRSGVRDFENPHSASFLSWIRKSSITL